MSFENILRLLKDPELEYLIFSEKVKVPYSRGVQAEIWGFTQARQNE